MTNIYTYKFVTSLSKAIDMEPTLTPEFSDQEIKHFMSQLPPVATGETNSFFGKKHTDETKLLYSIKRRGSGNSMFGSKRKGTWSKETLEKKSKSMKGKNSCAVMCEGILYNSIGEAENAYPGIKVRRRINSDKYPNFYRVGVKTRRK